MRNNDLIRYSSREVNRTSRAVSRERQAIREEVQVAALRTDATLALAGHIMEGVTQLDHFRKNLSGQDAALDMTLATIQHNAVLRTLKIQNDLFEPWGI